MDRTQWRNERRLWNEVQTDVMYAWQYDKHWGSNINPTHRDMLERLVFHSFGDDLRLQSNAFLSPRHHWLWESCLSQLDSSGNILPWMSIPLRQQNGLQLWMKVDLFSLSVLTMKWVLLPVWVHR